MNFSRSFITVIYIYYFCVTAARHDVPLLREGPVFFYHTSVISFEQAQVPTYVPFVSESSWQLYCVDK